MHNSFPFFLENIITNGTIVLIVIAIRPTMLLLPASIAMNITVKKWMTNIQGRMGMNTLVWPAWIVTPLAIMIRVYSAALKVKTMIPIINPVIANIF